jgi:hypothetical protein
MLETHHVGHYEEFSCIESSLQSYNKYWHWDEAIVEQISANDLKKSDDQETDEDDLTEREWATPQDATTSFHAGRQ